jgi:hypothetical protein
MSLISEAYFGSHSKVSQCFERELAERPGKIRMRQRLPLVAVEQRDVAGFGLPLA